jgi:hypothetical protein
LIEAIEGRADLDRDHHIDQKELGIFVASQVAAQSRGRGHATFTQPLGTWPLVLSAPPSDK